MNAPRLQVVLARGEADVRAAQRLRWQVFADELAARLDTPCPGLDIDRYDACCDHLLVRLGATGEVVGTYRLLGAEAARRAGGYYIAQEFELPRWRPEAGRVLELGRCCVHAAHRRGAVMALLWSGLADYLRTHPHEHLIGCVSIPIGDPLHDAAAIWRALRSSHLSPPAWRARPLRPLPLPPEPDPLRATPTARAMASVATAAAGTATTVAATVLHAPVTHTASQPALPPLLRAYLRAGAQVCGAPAWDPAFHTADLPMWLALDKLNPAHARHFLQA